MILDYFEHPHGKLFDLTYSSFGKPEMKNDIIRVPVREIGVYKGFPKHDESGKYYAKCWIVFTEVHTSVRMISESSPNGSEWLKQYMVLDGPFSTNTESKLILLSGALYEPKGWIEWYIFEQSTLKPEQPVSADGTALVTVWESRSLPTYTHFSPYTPRLF